MKLTYALVGLFATTAMLAGCNGDNGDDRYDYRRDRDGWVYRDDWEYRPPRDRRDVKRVELVFVNNMNRDGRVSVTALGRETNLGRYNPGEEIRYVLTIPLRELPTTVRWSSRDFDDSFRVTERSPSRRVIIVGRGGPVRTDGRRDRDDDRRGGDGRDRDGRWDDDDWRDDRRGRWDDNRDQRRLVEDDEVEEDGDIDD